MGLSYTGISCLETPSVIGYRRVPEPPARIIPLTSTSSHTGDKSVGWE